MTATRNRLTQYAHGGGRACKIPPGELENVVSGLVGSGVTDPTGELLVGLDGGDDGAVVRLDAGTAVIATADFFTPVVDSPFDWGRIAAANALSDVYAMGAPAGRGQPAVLAAGGAAVRARRRGAAWWSRRRGAGRLPRGGRPQRRRPRAEVRQAVTGLGDPERITRNDAGVAGLPLPLTKPLGIGVLNTRHRRAGGR